MTHKRLAIGLLLFFIALALPTSVLVYQAYGQLKWEAFHQHQQLARELTLRIDAGFHELVAREEVRPISDYEFLNVAGSDATVFLQRSPLSDYPLKSDVPGLIGYFQVDPEGGLSTPVKPESNARDYGVSDAELEQREQAEAEIRSILSQNKLVERPEEAQTSMAVARADEELKKVGAGEPKLSEIAASGSSGVDRDQLGQSVFDTLSARKSISSSASNAPSIQVRDLKLEDNYRVASEAESMEGSNQQKRAQQPVRARKEKVVVPETIIQQELSAQASDSNEVDEVTDQQSIVFSQQAVRIQTFESEVEPMEFSLLDSGHFVLFRRIWHNEARYVQGFLLKQDQFIEKLIAQPFEQSTLSSMSRLVVAYQGTVIKSFAANYSGQYRPGAGQVSDELLYQNRLIAPFGDVELIFALASLPVGAGGQVIIWTALVLSIVLIVGCMMLYRLGVRQLALARQQRDFVSAVSHELKTPLTSIRMYGEMLREGWADKEKRKSYYDFIFFEAERLTRLINNLLALAQISRNDQKANLDAIAVHEALAELKPRLESQLEASGIDLNMQVEPEAQQKKIRVDTDWFIQIFINLVDNAIKFSAKTESSRIDLHCKALSSGKIQISVRDYGPGIEPEQIKRIFKLFYRSEDELTRETSGTGIGLALVQELSSSMDAEVDVVNCEPGVAFRISFPAN